jgi:RimJ/RimL family protein N-acetyltransferase
VWRWCRQYTLIGPNAQKEWLEKIEKDPTIKMFGIYSPIGSFEPVGVCGLTSIDRVNQSAEFSLYIAPEHQRKGFARDALTTLLRHGFNDMNLNRIWGETYDGNHALEMFLKLGMVHEGTSKKAYFRNGKFIDSHRVAILREMFNGPAFVDVKSSVHRFDTLSSVVSVPAFTV